MKVASLVAMALLLCGTTGCHLSGHRCCLTSGGDDACGAMGCSKHYWGDWNHEPDPCDHCGNWVGDGCAEPAYQAPAYADAELYRQPPAWEEQPNVEPGYSIVPGSYRVTTRSGEPTPVRARAVSNPSQ